MKTILVPTSPHDLMPSALTTAWLAGQRFGAYLEGFALRPALTEYIPFDMVGGLTWVRDDAADDDASDTADDAAAGAITAVARAAIRDEKEDAIGIAVDEAGHRHV